MAGGNTRLRGGDRGNAKKGKESGAITMGIRESSYPLSYLDDKQQPIGYHIDVS